MQVNTTKEKVSRNDTCPCGSGKKYKKCCQNDNVQVPTQPDTALQIAKARQLLISNNFVDGTRILKNIIEKDNNNLEALILLSEVMTIAKQYKVAKKLYEKVITLLLEKKQEAETLQNDKLIEEFNKHLLKAYENYSKSLDILGFPEELFLIQREVIKIDPNNVQAHIAMGVAFGNRGLLNDALSCLLAANKINPNSALLQLCLGGIYKRMHNFEEAIKYYEQAIELDQSFILAKFSKFSTLHLMENLEEAYKYANEVILTHKGDKEVIKALQVGSALMTPTFMESQKYIDDFREEFNKRILSFIEDKSLILSRDYILIPTFLLAYHNRSNKEILQNLAKLSRQACPALNYIAPHCLNKIAREPVAKIKVGIFSQYLNNHSVSKCFAGLIIKLSKFPDIQLYVFSVNDNKDQIFLDTIKNAKHITISPKLEAAREQISACELDAFIYLDIGMDKLTGDLAFARLAPIQFVFGGHPDTTGIDTIDYYLSSKQYKPEFSKEFYSENLVMFDNLPVCYKKPQIPDKFLSLQELGLQEGYNYYFCPMMLQKIHPDFDDAVLKILQKDEKAKVIFVYPEKKVGHLQLTNRLKKKLSDLFERVVMIEFLPTEKYMSMLHRVNVLLDSFYFGGGNTSYIANTIGVPMITWPGNFDRGMVTMALYEKMGIHEPIAKSADDYVDIAVHLATDHEYNKKVREKILANNDIIFNNDGYADELAEFLRAAVNGGDISKYCAKSVN